MKMTIMVHIVQIQNQGIMLMLKTIMVQSTLTKLTVSMDQIKCILMKGTLMQNL